MLTAQDREYFGQDLVDFSRRAALEALGPEVRALQQQNQHLRASVQRAQRGEIERALDAQIPNWREIYHTPAFATWLSQPDDYSGEVRSRMMRHAVDNGDVGRVVAFYRGFMAEHGYRTPAAQQRVSQSRPAATSGSRIYTRPQIADLYKQRRLGHIPDSKWAAIEADIIKAGAENRVAGALSLTDGTEMSRLR
jgi:hypothetical protein